MKKLLFSVAALTFAAVSFAQPKTVADVAKFVSETIDLGKVKQGVPATAVFTVTNISKDPLIIEQANPTCGCTISNYTKEPIAPGKTGTINATYNAAGVSHFDKHLTVKFAGVDEVKSITISGDVLSAEDYDKWKVENDAKLKADADQKAKDAEAAKPVKKNKNKNKTGTTTPPVKS
jgi:hypothetical protein